MTQQSSAHVPIDPQSVRSVHDAARMSAARRLAWTTAIVTTVAVVATALAYGELGVAEAYYADDEAETRRQASQRPVSHFSLRALAADRIEATFWRGTSREYSVVARAGRGAQPIVQRDVDVRAWDGVARVAWSVDDSNPGDDAFTPIIRTATHGDWVFATHDEPCGTGTITQWSLCSSSSTEASRCIHAPNASACWHGPLRLVSLHETGTGKERVLWAVVEREMSDRTARMVAGVRSPTF
jgi:hypothetical protein